MNRVMILSPSSRDDSELEALMQAAQSSDEALGELLDGFRGWLEELAKANAGQLLSRKVSKSEIAQIVIVSSIESFHDFKGSTVKSLRAWLKRILENRLADLARHHVTAQARSISREGELVTSQFASNMERPSQIVSRAEDVKRLLRSICELPVELQQIVRMRYMDDRSFTEIGQALSMSEFNVRRRWHRALQQLRCALN